MSEEECKQLTSDDIINFVLNNKQECRLLILGFCRWVSFQGLRYETIYYGSDEDVKELVHDFIKWNKEEAENGTEN